MGWVSVLVQRTCITGGKCRACLFYHFYQSSTRGERTVQSTLFTRKTIMLSLCSRPFSIVPLDIT